ncbi:MAG: hypothetical protein ACE5IP_08680 [Terriglobia bacterium]
MSIVLTVAALLLLLLAGTVLLVKRKLTRLGENLPSAPDQWEEEIKKLEKPKG